MAIQFIYLELSLCNGVAILQSHYSDCCCCFTVRLQKLLNEKTTSVQAEAKQEEPAMADGKLSMPAKKVHGKELKGSPFISKPEVVLFKVPH